MRIDWLDTEGTPLIAIHGLPQAPEALLPLLPASAGMRRGLVHLPGYGASDPTVGPYDFGAVEDALLALLPAEPAVILGMSGGAFRALRLTLNHPERVRTLVLVAGLAGPRSDEERMQFLGFRDVLRTNTDLTALVRDRWMTPAEQGESQAASVVAWLHATSRENLALECEAYAAEPDLRSELGRIEVPVLVVAGADDAVAGEATARELVELLPKGELVLIPGAGHAVCAFHGERIRREIRAFLG